MTDWLQSRLGLPDKWLTADAYLVRCWGSGSHPPTSARKCCVPVGGDVSRSQGKYIHSRNFDARGGGEQSWDQGNFVCFPPLFSSVRQVVLVHTPARCEWSNSSEIGQSEQRPRVLGVLSAENLKHPVVFFFGGGGGGQVPWIFPRRSHPPLERVIQTRPPHASGSQESNSSTSKCPSQTGLVTAPIGER